MSSVSSTSTTSAASSTQSDLLGPLTTTWTPPSSCMQPWLACSTCSSAWQGQTCLSSASFEGDLNCWPSVTTSTATPPFHGLGYYSPGLYCPSGYQTACAMQGSSDGSQATVSDLQTFAFEYTPTLGETAIGCCPTGFACTSNNGQICGREVSSTSTTIWSCGTGGSTVTTALAFPESITITSAKAAKATSTDLSTISQFTVYAPLYQLNFQASDLASVNSTSSSSLQTTATSATTSSSSSSSASASTTGSSGKSSSHTTTIAVAVTVPIVVVALIAAGLGWFFYRKRAAKQRGGAQLNHTPTELSAHSPIIEMAASKPPVELASAVNSPPKNIPPPGTIVHEMDGGGQIQFTSGGYKFT